MTKTFLLGAFLGAILSAVIVSGCAGDAGLGDSGDSDRATVNQDISEREGGDPAGEHSEREGNGEQVSGGNGGGESREAGMSSPITPIGQSWSGVLGGLAVFMQYDATTRAVHGTVRNTLSQKLCYVQAEPHLKSGTKTVGELGPEKLGDLNPGQQATTRLSVASEPNLAGVSFDGYVVHMEVFDCSGLGPAPHIGGEGAEGGGGEHGPGGESGGESAGAGGEEGSANMLAPDETFDMVRSGARLILSYDVPSNSFKGTVENTTSNVLNQVRIEVHLSNGTELGPTTPTSIASGEVLAITLPATQASFTGWVAHAEVGGGGEGSESGGEHGSGGESGGERDEGSESGEESGSGGESGGERDEGGESGGEHGSGGESGGERGEGSESDGESGGGRESSGEHGSSGERRGSG